MEKDTYSSSCIFCQAAREFFICSDCMETTRNKLEGFQIAAIIPQKTNFTQLPTQSDDELPIVVHYKSTEELVVAMDLHDDEGDDGAWIYALNLVVYIGGFVSKSHVPVTVEPKDLLNISSIIRKYCNVICIVEHETDVAYDRLPSGVLCLVQKFDKKSIIEWFIQCEKNPQEDVLVIMYRN